MKCVELEIGLYHPIGGAYILDLRYRDPEGDAEVRLRGNAEPVFRNAKLREHNLEHDEYGEELTATLFHDQEVVNRFVEARAIARRQRIPLRVRLAIGDNAQDLQFYRWELLRDPDDGTPLGTNERILFSRYVASHADDPAGPRPRSNLRTLVVVSNPKELGTKTHASLDPLNVTKEVERAQAFFDSTDTTYLKSGGDATLQKLIDTLRQGYDILYIACHGKFVGNQTWLYLEKEDGSIDRVPGHELVTRFNELRRRPRIIIFASCESAGTGSPVEPEIGDGGALAPIGPTLAAEAGIGAVIAMQGNVLESTLVDFMQCFFTELREHGFVDRAAAVARGAVRDKPDWWAPVLYMRIQSGRIWYPQGFTSLGEGGPWRKLCNNIYDDECTPIVGPGFADSVLGTRQEIARCWAKDWHYPMAQQTRTDLPQVAQFIAIKDEQRATPQQELRRHLKRRLRERYGSQIPELRSHKDLSKIISLVGKMLRKNDEAEPHRLLAQLPLSIFVTTNPSNMLADAIAETDAHDKKKQPKKVPRVEWCRWNDEVEHVGRRPDGKLVTESFFSEENQSEENETDEDVYKPDPDNPVVYHLFGHLDEPNSIVLSEDDYFEYLIGSTNERYAMPQMVLSALTNGMLFLGYQLEDWNFRVLFRSILSSGGAARSAMSHFAQIAVQIDPEEGQISDPDGARNYLEGYFKSSANMHVYWGSSKRFIKELLEHWDKYSDD